MQSQFVFTSYLVHINIQFYNNSSIKSISLHIYKTEVMLVRSLILHLVMSDIMIFQIFGTLCRLFRLQDNIIYIRTMN